MPQAATNYRSYMDEIGRHHVLTREQEQSLFKTYAQTSDPEARDMIVQCNLRFVIRIAQQFKGRGIPLEDLVQEGAIGLMEAIVKFDHTLGFRFSTYAAFWIRQSIQVAVRQRGSLIRIPVRKSRQLGFLAEIVQEYRNIHGRPPTEEEVADRLDITAEKARELARLSETVLSLDAPIDEEGSPLMDLIPDRDSPSIQDKVLENERSEKIAQALELLTDRESRVIRQRYGFTAETGRSLRRVSDRLGLSQEGVRRIEQRALNKLRRPHASRSLGSLI